MMPQAKRDAYLVLYDTGATVDERDAAMAILKDRPIDKDVAHVLTEYVRRNQRVNRFGGTHETRSTRP